MIHLGLSPFTCSNRAKPASSLLAQVQGLVPAQGSVKPTVGFKFNKVISPSPLPLHSRPAPAYNLYIGPGLI